MSRLYDLESVLQAYSGSSSILAIHLGETKLWPKDAVIPVTDPQTVHSVISLGIWQDDAIWDDDGVWVD